jgi:hypothetical protein
MRTKLYAICVCEKFHRSLAKNPMRFNHKTESEKKEILQIVKSNNWVVVYCIEENNQMICN